MWFPRGVIWLYISLSMLFHSQASDIGDQISRIVKDFADEGLGTADMQDYVKNDVPFVTETIDEKTVAEIAGKMSDKIRGRHSILEHLKRTLEGTSSTAAVEIGNSGFHSCCDISPQGQSKLHGNNVNTEEWCLLGDSLFSNDPPEHFLPKETKDNFKESFTRAGDIKYVYFGTEDGVLYNYPGIRTTSCGSYDPRFRPWYVETATPEPKDVVIVIDRSSVMQLQSSSDQKTLMDVATEAARTVVDTLTPNDRVGIVIFSDDAETPPGDKDNCYSTTLAKANPINKDYLRRFVAYIKAEGDTHYIKALKKAFEYFQNMPAETDDRKRDKVLLFLTGGTPDDSGSPESVYSTLSDLNGQLNNSVVVLTYFLSTATNNEATEILTHMARQTFSNSSFGDINEGKYTHVSKPDNLRTEMAEYYSFFKSSNANAKPTFSVPFLDIFELSDVLISMCLPVEIGGPLKGGVVCMDQLVDDILSDVTYFRKGGLSYAFVIDADSRVLSHPLLSNPADVTNDPTFIKLDSLEIGNGIESVRLSMIRGEIGMKTLSSIRVTARGSLDTEGVYKDLLDSTYYWHPVNETSFSVCIVNTKNKNFERVNWESSYPSVFSYHKNRILARPSDTCKYFAREALEDQGNVKFAPRSFLKPYLYISREETTYDTTEYQKYFTGQTHSASSFRPYVRDHVAFSYKFEELMKSRQSYGDYAVWRYFGTEEGVVRLYPGAEISTMYDPSLRSWYVRAMSSQSLYSISTPYEDAFGAGIVVTLSKAIMSKSGDVAVGVMGVDFTMPYFFYLLTQDIPDCNIYECLVIDGSGFVILNSKWFEPGAPEIKHIEGIHISSVEPEIANDLTKTGLQASECINMIHIRTQRFWKFSLSETDTGVQSWYQIHEISDTNIYLLIKTGPPTSSASCHCPSKQNNIELCSSRSLECFCPCFTDTDKYSYCPGVFNLRIGTDAPCSPPIPSVDFSHLTSSEESKIETLETCRDYKCDQRASRELCLGVASCTWCDSEDGISPFCGTWGECHLGPQTEADEPQGTPVWIIIVSAIVGLLLCVGVIVAIVCIVKRRSFKDPKRPDLVPNPYTGLDAKPGCSSHAHGAPQCKEEELEEGVYFKLRESKVNLNHISPAEDNPYVNTRPRSEDLPPPPDRVHYTPAPSAKTLPASVQGLSDEYLSSKAIVKPKQTPEDINMQGVANTSGNTGNLPPSSGSTGDTTDDVYLKASTVPPPKGCRPVLEKADPTEDDVYLKPADVKEAALPPQ